MINRMVFVKVRVNGKPVAATIDLPEDTRPAHVRLADLHRRLSYRLAELNKTEVSSWKPVHKTYS